MKRVRITREEFDELRRIQKVRRWDWPAWFGANNQGAIWPGVTRGYTPFELREDVREVSKLLDLVADVYLLVRDKGGRFFIGDQGAFFKDEGTVQFIEFKFPP